LIETTKTKCEPDADFKITTEDEKGNQTNKEINDSDMHEINKNVRKSANINKTGKETMKADAACDKTEFKKENASAVASAFGLRNF